MCLRALICVVLLCALLLFFFFARRECNKSCYFQARPHRSLFSVHGQPICELRERYPPLSFYSHCLQRTLIARTLCTGYCAKTKKHIQGKEEGRRVRVMTQGVYAALFALARRSWTSFPLQVGQELMNPHARMFFPFANCNAQLLSCGSKHGRNLKLR